jgi:FixJ family two-component response regulator
MNLNPPTVFAVDDDAVVRRGLERLLRSAGLAVRSFASAQEYLDQGLDEPGCLVLDVSMPKLSGLGLQAALAARGIRIPIVFLTGHADISMSVQAMKGGAADFLTKPFRAKDLPLATRPSPLARPANARLTALTRRLRKPQTPGKMGLRAEKCGKK